MNLEAGKKRKTGLVLEGGAMRGLFSAGILDVMMENKLRTDGLIGVSAGAAFGCNYKSVQIGRAIRYNKKYCRDARYCSWQSWIRTGDLFGAEFCYHELPEKLDRFDCAAYDSNPLEFYLVCTDVHTGLAEYHRCPAANPECFEWMRASGSMPLVSRIVSVGGGQYLDGAIADSIPLRFFEHLGYERNIVILTQPAGYLKKPSAVLGLLKMVYRKYPALLRAMERRHKIYNETVNYVEAQAALDRVLLLRPESTLPVRRISRDPEQLQRTYDLGRMLAEKKLKAIKSFLD
ncbi:MAG: patatin family protein [Lentisphaeria bacterium]|nr:patatin family protein [Lentisphaeria bacterium]